MSAVSSESGSRQIVFTAKLTTIVGAVSLLFLFLPPNIVKTIQEPSALALLVVGFLAGFAWQHGRLDHWHSEWERNESKGVIYTQSSFYVVGSKMNLISHLPIVLIPLFLIPFFGRESYYIILRVLLASVFMGWSGITSATLLWERRRHLRTYQKKIAPRQWLIYFNSTNNLEHSQSVSS